MNSRTDNVRFPFRRLIVLLRENYDIESKFLTNNIISFQRRRTHRHERLSRSSGNFAKFRKEKTNGSKKRFENTQGSM